MSDVSKEVRSLIKAYDKGADPFVGNTNVGPEIHALHRKLVAADKEQAHKDRLVQKYGKSSGTVQVRITNSNPPKETRRGFVERPEEERQPSTEKGKPSMMKEIDVTGYARLPDGTSLAPEESVTRKINVKRMPELEAHKHLSVEVLA